MKERTYPLLVAAAIVSLGACSGPSQQQQQRAVLSYWNVLHDRYVSLRSQYTYAAAPDMQEDSETDSAALESGIKNTTSAIDGLGAPPDGLTFTPDSDPKTVLGRLKLAFEAEKAYLDSLKVADAARAKARLREADAGFAKSHDAVAARFAGLGGDASKISASVQP